MRKRRGVGTGSNGEAHLPFRTAPNCVDLFCGAGGLSLGLRMAGFDLVCAVDSRSPAIQTYQQNLGDHAREQQIAEEIELPDADVIAGGPPCQGFSSAGMRRQGDARNTLVSLFARIVVRQRPLAFVFENVEGFLTSEDGAYVLDLLCPLIEAGYCIHLRKVNAANFGVPQHRKRVIVIGGLGWNPTSPSQPTPPLAHLELVWPATATRTRRRSAMHSRGCLYQRRSRRATRQGTFTGRCWVWTLSGHKP